MNSFQGKRTFFLWNLSFFFKMCLFSFWTEKTSQEKIKMFFRRKTHLFFCSTETFFFQSEVSQIYSILFETFDPHWKKDRFDVLFLCDQICRNSSLTLTDINLHFKNIVWTSYGARLFNYENINLKWNKNKTAHTKFVKWKHAQTNTGAVARWGRHKWHHFRINHDFFHIS